MTSHRGHQIGPTLSGDGPMSDGPLALDRPGPPSAPWLQQAKSPSSGYPTFARCFLPPEPRAVKTAREFTRTALGSFGTSELFDDAAVVISELVTNAVQCGPRAGVARTAADARIEVVLVRHGSQLLCVVTDSNPGQPVSMDPDYGAEDGRGLWVVEAMSSLWGWTPLCRGRKAVWAVLPCGILPTC